MTIEMSANKLVNLRLGGGMKVLEFMHGLELDNVQAVGDDAIRLAF